MRDNELSAVVNGTTSYHVRLWCDEGSLAHSCSCSCPVGETERCCKLCVATGLVWLRGLDARDGVADNESPQAVEVRERHKPKRNLMKLLDKKGW